MRVVQRSYTRQVDFFHFRLARWAENAEALGILPGQLEALEVEVAEARAALNAQSQAMAAARGATARFETARKKMLRTGAAVIKRVRSSAGGDGKSTYPLSLIPRPEKPSKIGPPGTPCDFEHMTRQDGSIRLKWKCKQPRKGLQGTVYEVFRQTDGQGPFRFLATVGERAFVDTLVPPRVAEITYRVQAIRGKTKGPLAFYPLRLCSDPGLHRLEKQFRMPRRVIADAPDDALAA